MSSVAENTSESPVVFTSSAAAKVAELIKEEGNPGLMLRIYIQGGGCSGFQYGFTFDESVNEGDTSVETNGVTMLIDPRSSLCTRRGKSFRHRETVLVSRCMMSVNVLFIG